MGSPSKHHEPSSSPFKRALPNFLGPFILEEISPTSSASQNTRTTPNTPAPAAAPVMLHLPSPELPVEKRSRARPGDDQTEEKERFKGLLTRLKGSQSQVQISTTAGSSKRYGPVLPLTEDLLGRFTGKNLTSKEKIFETRFALMTRYNEPEDNTGLADSYIHPHTRPWPPTIHAQPEPIYHILADKDFDANLYLPAAAGRTTLPENYDFDGYPGSEPCGSHSPPPSQSPRPSEVGRQFLDQAVFQPPDDFTAFATETDQSPWLDDHSHGPFVVNTDDMSFESVRGRQSEQRSRAHSREPMPVVDEKAIQGNFIPVSHSASRGRGSGRSKHKTQNSYETVLRLSLTDAQVSKITSVLSNEDGDAAQDRERSSAQKDTRTPQSTLRSRSPDKASHSKTHSASRRAQSAGKRQLGKSHSGNTVKSYGVYEFEPEDHAADNSPTKGRTLRSAMKQSGSMMSRSSSPLKQSSSMMSRSSSPKRMHRTPPAPINTQIAREDANAAVQSKNQGVPYIIHRPPFESCGAATTAVHFAHSAHSQASASSVYSNDYSRYPSHISPLRIDKNKARTTAGSSPDDLPIVPELASQENSPDDPPSALMFSRFPGERKSSKTLIGHNGWLEKTSKPGLPSAAPEPKKVGFFDNVIKKAKGIMHSTDTTRHSIDPPPAPKPGARALAISLRPREQSIVTCELEYAMTCALNHYLEDQFNAGRLDPSYLKRVALGWQAKGRPRVVGFRYDLETQLELVRLHVQEFKFYGHAATKTAVLGILDMAATNARVLRVRTFCQPDTVLAKQLLDAQGLFNLLGCPEEQQWMLAEITAYYKAAVERDTEGHKQREGTGVVVPEGVGETQERLRHAKSISGEKWNNTTPAGAGGRAGGGGPERVVRRTASFTGWKMGPAEYDSSDC